jgi:ATP-dependent DNA helicase HFM1/MER3
LKAKYEALTFGETCIESSLHENLAEHLNSEIGLRTITNLESARSWLQSTFLFQRIQQNPDRYTLRKDEHQDWCEKAEEIIWKNVHKLQANQLVTYTSTGPGMGRLESTEFGDIMSKVRKILHLFTLPDSF